MADSNIATFQNFLKRLEKQRRFLNPLFQVSFVSSRFKGTWISLIATQETYKSDIGKL